jgi:hypothetical protein
VPETHGSLVSPGEHGARRALVAVQALMRR